jgi:hypothetical protein
MTKSSMPAGSGGPRSEDLQNDGRQPGQVARVARWGARRARILLQVGLNGFNEAVCRVGLFRTRLSVGIKDVKSDLVFKQLHH